MISPIFSEHLISVGSVCKGFKAFFFAVLFTAVLFSSAPAFANETNTAEETEKTEDTKELEEVNESEDVKESEDVNEEDEPRVIAYDDALKMALEELTDIITIDDNIKYMKEQRNDLQKQLKELNNTRGPKGEKAPSSETAPLKNSISSLGKQMDSLKLNQDMIRLSTEMSLRNTLVNIDNYWMDIALLEATITLNEENIRRVDLKKQYGMATDNDLRAAEQTLAQNKKDMEALLISLASEQQSLNKILQLPLTDQIVVEYEQTFEDLPEDLEAYITDKRKNEITMQQQQITVDIKKGDMRSNEDNSKKTSLQNEYDKSLRERDDAQNALEATIRAYYNNLDQLMQQEQNLQIELEKAYDQQRVLEANLKAGLVTQYDLSNAALAITRYENEIIKNQSKYWLLLFRFMHPFM